MRTLYASSPDWATLGERLDELLAGPDFRALKNTPRTLAGVLRSGGTEVFVKRVASSSFAAGLVARLLGSHAAKALRGAEILTQTGFAHPRPLAAFEKHERGAIRASYTITELLRRPRILSRFALADGRDFRRRQWLSECLAREIRRLHDAGCYTLDLQETNLMLEAHGRQLTIYFVDLGDFRRRNTVPRRLRVRNLIHLDRSIGRFLSRSQRLRFLYNYLGGKPAHRAAADSLARLRKVQRRLGQRKRSARPEPMILSVPDSAAAAGAETHAGQDKDTQLAQQSPGRLLINHNLLPLSCLPREGAGEKVEERSHLLRRVLRAVSMKLRWICLSQHPAGRTF